MVNLTIATVFKDENKWLREWLEYHLIVGVDHFIMFNNGDSLPAFKILEPYIDAKKVTYYDFVHHQGDLQIQAFDLALQYHRDSTKWMGFLDLDEFVFPIYEDKIYPCLQPFELEWVSGLNIPVATFGTSFLNLSPKLQTESFVYRAKTEHPSNYTAKQFFLTEKHTSYEYGGNIDKPGMVNPDGKQNRYNKLYRKSDHIRVNHYATRSYEDWHKKVKKGWPNGRPGGDITKTMWDKKFLMSNQNTILDESIHRFLPELKSKLCISA